MELWSSNVNANGGHRTEPTPTSRGSRTTRDNVASPGRKHSDSQTGQFEPRSRNDTENLLQANGAGSFHKSGRNSTAASAANRDCEVSYTPLTAQTLHEHDLQQATCSQPFNFRDAAAQQGDITSLEAAVAGPLEGPTDDLQIEGATGFNIKLYSDPLSRLLMYWDQTQSQQRSIASTYNEADIDTSIYQGTGPCPRSSHQEHIMARPGHDECNIEFLSWNMDPDRELTAWGNCLAGIGEHFAGSTYQEHAGGDDFVVD